MFANQLQQNMTARVASSSLDKLPGKGPISRCLYVDDIPGAKPTKRAFDKSMLLQKHHEEIQRFGGNPQHRIIDWYSPTKKPTEPLDRDDGDHWKTKKTLQKAFQIHESDLSKSQPIGDLIKNEGLNSSSSNMHKSSILTSSAAKFLNSSSAGGDPYFPHRYIDTAAGQANKWSGNRQWIHEPSESIRMPSTKSNYYRKW